MIPGHIFREYDIRGIVDKDLTENVVRLVGQAFGTGLKRLGKREITCGRDGRLHSKRLQDALIQGVISTGINVINIGEVPTPLLYFSIYLT